MKITDIFIKRPVLATVVSLVILTLGIRSLSMLPIREYPFTENAVITVSTVYVGAAPEVVAGFITTPLETSIAQATGIDYLVSSSTQGVSTIQAYLQLNYDSNKALSDINTKVNAVLNQLPKQSQLPVITIAVGESIDSMYIGFYSNDLDSNQITDYLIRVVQPKLQAVNGVQLAEIIGNRQFAMRAWLDPMKLTSYGITSQDVANALAVNDFISAIGRTDGQAFTVNMTAATGLHSVDEFKKMVIKAKDGAIVRLSDVAKIELGAQNYDTSVKFDNLPAVYIGIKVAPAANLLEVVSDVRKAFPEIESQLPQGLNGRIVYDATKYVNAAINEVESSLIEALLIVTFVIFIFLGSMQSVLIALVAIPLSLVGAFFIMYMLHYTVNLLTLLAMVLAIGLVVDDAIIIIENIHRHMESGMSKLDAAIQGARELANPIIAITIVLIAVYLPIGFMGGLTGALFTEFAFTLAGTVTISAIVALTLSPMMCSKLLKITEKDSGRFVRYIDDKFERVKKRYAYLLSDSLNYLPVTAVFAIIIFCSIYFLYITSKTELAPQEDQGIVIAQITGAPNATLAQTEANSQQVNDIFASFSEMDHTFQLNGIGGLNAAIAGMVMKPWNERSRTTNQLQPKIQAMFNTIAGAKVVAFQRPSLPGGGSGLPIQFVIKTTDTFAKLNTLTREVIDKSLASGLFMYMDSDLKIDKAQTSFQLDRDKAAQLGLTMQDIANVLASSVSQNYINYFNFDGRSYQVIPQTIRDTRLNSDQLLDYYITTADGSTIPFSTFATMKTNVVPESLNHFQQLNSSTVSAIAAPGVTMGQALQTLNSIAIEVLPQGFTIDYAGQSRQFEQEGRNLMITFLFSLIVIFLALAALFESFRDPLIVLISVPMSICGALIFISLGFGGLSLNIYSEVGLITLMGLISKHGILIVQFANDLQAEGKSKREAIETAAAIRLRPIIMTSAAMILGVFPLIIATGAGAVSRFNIGIVICSGIAIGTLFTLFVVPAMYLFLAKEHVREINS